MATRSWLWYSLAMAWFLRARGGVSSVFFRTGCLALIAAAGCAAGDDQVPTGAAATGEPTGGGGGDGQGGAGQGASGQGASDQGTGTTTSSSTATSTGTGDGGGTSSTGQGGDGGSGEGGDGTTTGPGGGGGQGGAGGSVPESGVLTVLATGPTSAFRAAREEGSWISSEVVGTFAAASRPAIAMRGPAAATGLLRGSTDTLLATTWNGSAWTSPTPLGGAITTGDTPAIASSGNGVAHATFHGVLTDFHYYARHDGAAWSPDDELIAVGDASSFGPTPAAIAVVGGDPLVAYAGADDGLYVQQRTGAAWSSALDVSGSASVDVTPAVAALPASADGDAIVVFAANDSTVWWTRREPGGWTAPELVDDAFTLQPPAVAATADGGAVATFRGTNGGVYAALFDGDAATWSAPERVVPIVTTPSSPAVATGIGPADADLVYVDGSSGAVSHVRLVGGAWTDATVLGGRDLTGVALASAP